MNLIRKKRKEPKDCGKCPECVYIGDGDFVCTVFEEIAISDWVQVIDCDAEQAKASRSMPVRWRR